MKKVEFDHIRLDAIKEISSIATGNAATSLSAMLGRKVYITVPSVMVEAAEKIPELLGGREEATTVVYFSVRGQVQGSILLMFLLSESLGLVYLLTGQKVDKFENLDEMGLSALKELGNIVTGSYIRVLAQELNVKLSYSVPGFAYDMLGAILDQTLARLSSKTRYAVIMESEFMVREKVSRGHLVFILAPSAVSAIIKALGNWQK